MILLSSRFSKNTEYFIISKVVFNRTTCVYFEPVSEPELSSLRLGTLFSLNKKSNGISSSIVAEIVKEITTIIKGSYLHASLRKATE